MLVAFQLFALVAGVLCNHVVRHALAQEDRCGEVTPNREYEVLSVLLRRTSLAFVD
jgi:hypothetical protein